MQQMESGIKMYSQEEIKNLFEQLQPLCIAIYYGGSRVDKYIENPHDYDYICFTNTKDEMKFLKDRLHKVLKTEFQNVVGLDDFIQVRNKEEEEKAV